LLNSKKRPDDLGAFLFKMLKKSSINTLYKNRYIHTFPSKITYFANSATPKIYSYKNQQQNIGF